MSQVVRSPINLGARHDLAVLHTGRISRCGHEKRGGKCGKTDTCRPDGLTQPAHRLFYFSFHRNLLKFNHQKRRPLCFSVVQDGA